MSEKKGRIKSTVSVLLAIPPQSPSALSEWNKKAFEIVLTKL